MENMELYGQEVQFKALTAPSQLMIIKLEKMLVPVLVDYRFKCLFWFNIVTLLHYIAIYMIMQIIDIKSGSEQ